MARQQSLDSERPIMPPSHRSSRRFSTFSNHSHSTILTNDSRTNEIRELGEGLERLENKRLSQQRFVPTPEKSESLSKLALGAKVERALGRRMTGQDAVMREGRSRGNTVTAAGAGAGAGVGEKGGVGVLDEKEGLKEQFEETR